MSLHYKSQENISDSVGLLISILVRYPEVATINFDPAEQVLKFTFILNGKSDVGEIKSKIKNKVLDGIEVYNQLEGKVPRVVLVAEQKCDQFTLIEIQRDVDTLVQEEIALIVKLFNSSFRDCLITDQNDSLIEEDLLMQEELIEHMLENVKCRADDKYLYAFREEGRVLVFNK